MLPGHCDLTYINRQTNRGTKNPPNKYYTCILFSFSMSDARYVTFTLIAIRLTGQEF